MAAGPQEEARENEIMKRRQPTGTQSKGGYDFLAGTFLPSLRASESPMAMACFGLVTFLPLRPDFSLPCFIACISLLTSWPAEGEYLRRDDFFDADFFEADFLDDEERVLFFAVLPREVRERELPFFELLLDFFLAAFLVAILSSSEVR
jgi:hypothetical protein